jgi:hypothetical protein
MQTFQHFSLQHRLYIAFACKYFKARVQWYLYAKFASKFVSIFARISSVAKVRRRETVMAGEGGGQETCFSPHYPVSQYYKL